MLNADSSALKRESDDQARKTAPMIPSVAALSWIPWTTRRIVSSELVGKARSSSRTKKSDASARREKPRSASERKTSGTNDRSAKYAIIAARCVPRSRKNLANGFRTRRSMRCGSVGGRYGRAAGPWRPDRHLGADLGRGDRAAVGRGDRLDAHRRGRRAVRAGGDRPAGGGAVGAGRRGRRPGAAGGRAR